MRRKYSRRLALCAALLFCACPFLPAAPSQPIKRLTVTGKVVPLASLVAKLGSKLDADAAPYALVLVAEDGKVYPLVKDAGARMFFKDKRLLNRPMRLIARALPGSEILQVLEVSSLNKGRLHEIYYWCDVCSIRRNEKMDCECCGGPMLLKEEPLGK